MNSDFVVGSFRLCFVFKEEDGIRDYKVTGVQTCALPIYLVTYAKEEKVVEPENVEEWASKIRKQKK